MGEGVLMKKITRIGVIAGTCLIFLLTACELLVQDEEILYEVNTSPSTTVDITYTDSDGNTVTVTANDQDLPWSKTVKNQYGDGTELDEVTLTATASDSGTIEVTATITWSK
jgi:hypothetical protein